MRKPATPKEVLLVHGLTSLGQKCPFLMHVQLRRICHFQRPNWTDLSKVPFNMRLPILSKSVTSLETLLAALGDWNELLTGSAL